MAGINAGRTRKRPDAKKSPDAINRVPTIHRIIYGAINRARGTGSTKKAFIYKRNTGASEIDSVETEGPFNIDQKNQKMRAKSGPNRSTTRAKWYDYASNGIYFVTIVCQHRKQFFGCVLNGTVSLSKAGILADSLWRQIPEEFPNVELDQFIIMPNHIHGILVLRNQEQEAIDEKSNIRGGVTANKNPMLHTGLPRIIRWFKGRFSYEVKKHLHSFAWQPRYHERIIRSPQELVNTKKYIQTNPHRWQHP